MRRAAAAHRIGGSGVSASGSPEIFSGARYRPSLSCSLRVLVDAWSADDATSLIAPIAGARNRLVPSGPRAVVERRATWALVRLTLAGAAMLPS
jgi:hypothetical protein